MTRGVPEGAALLDASEERVLDYLYETDRPDWERITQNPAFTEKWVILFLQRNRPIPREAYQEVYKNRAWRKTYRVAVAMLRCKSAPPALAMNLVPYIRWVDLMHTLRIPYLSGAVKKRIEDEMTDIIPRMALGERIAMARQAPRGLVKHLRKLAEPRVIGALLLNQQFTYEDAIFMASYPRSKGPALAELAGSPRWSAFKEVKLALLRHANTPNHCVLPLIRSLSVVELKKMLKDPKLKRYTRQLITRLLGDRAAGAGGRVGRKGGP